MKRIILLILAVLIFFSLPALAVDRIAKITFDQVVVNDNVTGWIIEKQQADNSWAEFATIDRQPGSQGPYSGGSTISAVPGTTTTHCFRVITLDVEGNTISPSAVACADLVVPPAGVPAENVTVTFEVVTNPQ